MKFQIVAITLLATLIITSVSGCIRPKFEDAALDVPKIAVLSYSIDETGRLTAETAADRKPNDPLGGNQSPHLTWDAVDGAAYYAVSMFDETANWLHWLVLDIDKTELAQGEYTNDYIGPYPPKNSGRHDYRIEVFALIQETDNLILKIDAKQTYSDIVRYLNRSGNGENNVIARGYIIGTYEN